MPAICITLPSMSQILILGAGRSSSSLISYLLNRAEKHSWSIVVGDFSIQAAQTRIGNSSFGQAVEFDIRNETSCATIIQKADVVISLLPPHFHPVVAKMCLQFNKHLLTASYVSDEMNAYHKEALSKNLLFLNECGLDPGIDHMSAVKIIDEIHSRGGKLVSFESFTGGLIAPDTDPENPWRYKFTWNPRNVVMAGQGTARFLQDGKIKYIPYQQLFNRYTEIEVPGYGKFEGYANRDSLKYRDTYQLPEIQTMLRGTLRFSGFCSAWNILVQLGCCDDTYSMEQVDMLTHAGFLDSFLPGSEKQPVEQRLQNYFKLDASSAEMKRLKWSGLFTEEKVGLIEGTPARILEHILNKKWSLAPHDKDFIVMIHRFIYELNGQRKTIQSSLAVTGEDSVQTAMAKTVGLPLGIAARLLMQGKLSARGVVIPTLKEIYEPVLKELDELGISMVDQEV